MTPGFIIGAVVLAGGAFAHLVHELLRGALTVNWADFPELPGPDRDRILLQDEPGPTGFLTVTMTTACPGNNIRWWKAAEVYDQHGRYVGPPLGAWVENDEHSRTVQIPYGDYLEMTNWFLVLKKAKLFGVHTSMYAIFGLAGKADRSLSFTWERD